MLKKPHLVALGLVTLLVVVLFSLPQKVTGQLKLALSGFFLPIFGLSEVAGSTVRRAGNYVVPRKDLIRELEKLREENQRLALHSQQYIAVEQENDRLRKMAGLPQRVDWNLKIGKIVARDPANWWQTVFINLGRRDGVMPDMPVMTVAGLVGKIASVSNTRAQVLLLTDPNCRVAAVVGQTGETGIIMPYIPDATVVTLTYLAGSSQLSPGQAVITGGLLLKPGHEVLSSGLGGIFPRGIPIGRILDVRSVDYGLYQEARVKLSAQLGKLDEIWVITK